MTEQTPQDTPIGPTRLVGAPGAPPGLPRGLGWLPDLPDHRDYHFAYDPSVTIAQLPPAASIRQRADAAIPIFDQGQLGSCVAQSTSFAMDWLDVIDETPGWTPASRLFVYYCGRSLEHSIQYDSGLMIRDGIKAVAQYGAADEAKWPYLIERFRKKPTPRVYQNAKQRKAVEYYRLDQRLEAFAQCLVDGFPIVFGATLYESFIAPTTIQTGQVPMPGQSERVIGGHSMAITGYDLARGAFEVRNSWGPNFGQGGYLLIPFSYLLNPYLANDFWMVKRVGADPSNARRAVEVREKAG